MLDQYNILKLVSDSFNGVQAEVGYEDLILTTDNIDLHYIGGSISLVMVHFNFPEKECKGFFTAETFDRLETIINHIKLCEILL